VACSCKCWTILSQARQHLLTFGNLVSCCCTIVCNASAGFWLRFVAGGVHLQMLDLSESDWAAFGEQVKQLAEQQEKQAGKFQVRRQHMLLMHMLHMHMLLRRVQACKGCYT
jgi:hypothetical protein